MVPPLDFDALPEYVSSSEEEEEGEDQTLEKDTVNKMHVAISKTEESVEKDA